MGSFFVIKTKPIFLRLHRITLYFSVFSTGAEVKAKRSKKFEPKLPLKQAVHLVQSRKRWKPRSHELLLYILLLPSKYAEKLEIPPTEVDTNTLLN